MPNAEHVYCDTAAPDIKHVYKWAGSLPIRVPYM